MQVTRRAFLRQTLAAAAAAAVFGCQRNTATGPKLGGTLATNSQNELPPPPQLVIDQAQKRAINYLLEHQSSNGAWKSDTYGVFKDGTALTPLVLSALLAVEPDHAAARKAARWLADFVQSNGSIKPPSYGFDFSLYTSAVSVTIFSHPAWKGAFNPQRGSWLNYLRERQLTEELGWKPEDREYGGWGYCRTIPRKGKAGELVPPLLESNLSATTFALEALKAGGVLADDPSWKKALTFVKRCQNWNDDEEQRDEKFDDGGFFFIYDDPVRNKAGVAGTDRRGIDRYFSYGSTTADGLRCLLSCGEKNDSARVQVARKWLGSNFEASIHPGTYAPLRELDRQATYFYYAASMARTPIDQFMVLNKQKKIGMWIESLGQALLASQRPDGSWVNPAHAFRENEPLVATPFAVLALAEVRKPHHIFLNEGDQPRVIK